MGAEPKSRGEDGMLDRPIFIVGSARSGTTLVRACLERSRALWRLGRSSEYLFERWFHPLRSGRRDHVLGADDATAAIREEIVAAWFGEELPEGPPFAFETGEIPPFSFLEPGVRPTADDAANGLRIVDKDPAHVFRIPFLEALFPDARFVFVVRDGTRAVSSLIEAWRHPRWFFTYRMPV